MTDSKISINLALIRVTVSEKPRFADEEEKRYIRTAYYYYYYSYYY